MQVRKPKIFRCRMCGATDPLRPHPPMLGTRPPTIDSVFVPSPASGGGSGRGHFHGTDSLREPPPQPSPASGRGSRKAVRSHELKRLFTDESSTESRSHGGGIVTIT